MAPQYGEVEYWNQRYTDSPGEFDWYQGYVVLRPLLRKHLPQDEPVLQVGVGTSRIQVDMAEDGYRKIVNTDYASVCVDTLRREHEGYPGLQYLVSDCRDMPEFKNEEFGSVLDKGTLDAIMCGADSHPHAASMAREIYRVLAPGGVFMLITYGAPDTRVPHVARPELEWASIQAYALLRREAASAAQQEEWDQGLIEQEHRWRTGSGSVATTGTQASCAHAGGAGSSGHADRDSSCAKNGAQANGSNGEADVGACSGSCDGAALVNGAACGSDSISTGNADVGCSLVHGEAAADARNGEAAADVHSGHAHPIQGRKQEGKGASSSGTGCGGGCADGGQQWLQLPMHVQLLGPYDVRSEAAMGELGRLQDAHFIYVFTKAEPKLEG